MYFQIALINAILFASLTNASDIKPSIPTGHVVLSTAATFPASASMMFETGTDFFIPNSMLDEEVKLTLEESQLRRVSLGKILARLSKSSPGKIGKFDSSKLHKSGKHVTTMLPEIGEQDTNTPITSDSITGPDLDKAENTDADYRVDDEGNADLDASPEETELRRGGRGGRGRGGRRRGRFGRGRFGRGGRFGRFSGHRFSRFGRFGRFGGWGSGWNDDCGGDDCGDC